MKLKALIDKEPLLQNVECGVFIEDGWVPLIQTLCEVIHLHCEVNKLPLPTVGQVKEKFGTLRFYVDSCDEYVSGAINLAESMSHVICEGCGKPGTLIAGGWLKTFCASCKKKYFKK